MSYEFSTLSYIRFLSGGFALFLVGLLWRQRHSKGVIYLMLFELAAAIWAIGDGFEAAALTLPLKIHWSQFAYTGIATCTVMFLMFALSYTNQNRFANLQTLLILLVIPLVTVIVAFTNPHDTISCGQKLKFWKGPIRVFITTDLISGSRLFISIPYLLQG